MCVSTYSIYFIVFSLVILDAFVFCTLYYLLSPFRQGLYVNKQKNVCMLNTNGQSLDLFQFTILSVGISWYCSLLKIPLLSWSSPSSDSSAIVVGASCTVLGKPFFISTKSLHAAAQHRCLKPHCSLDKLLTETRFRDCVEQYFSC